MIHRTIKLFVCCCVLILPVLTSAQTEIDTEKLNRFFTELEQNNRFMGSVALLKGDELVFNQAYGITDQQQNPATNQTVYRVGSITKTYTTAMIFKLAEEGRLSTDDKLSDYFPTIPNAETITLSHLLRHQSGLENFTNRPDYMDYHTTPQSREEMLTLFESLETSFEPGQGQEYSNSAYVLLGYIIEDVTGKSYSEALKNLITDPLGLDSTAYGQAIDTTANEAESFSFEDGGWSLSSQTHMSIPHGAGAVVATSHETAKFYKALLEGELLGDESLSEMMNFQGALGAGLFRFPFANKTAIGHNGGIDGFQSGAAVFQDDEITFAILGNGVNFNFNELQVGFLQIVFGHDYEIPDFTIKETLTLSEDELRAFTGDYQSPNFPMNISLFIQDGRLMGQATGQGAFPFAIVDEHTLVFEQAGLELVFDPKEGERFETFTLHQAGRSFKFSRLQD